MSTPPQAQPGPAQPVPYQPPPGAVLMGRWVVQSVPAGWFFVPGFGLRHDAAVEPASNITVRDDILLAGNKLEPYIQAQMTILRHRFDEPIFAGPRPSPPFAGADEAAMLLIKHKPFDGKQIFQVQTYARLGTWIGILTLSTLEAMVPTVRPAFEQFVQSLLIAPEPAPAAPAPTGGEGQGTP